MLVEVSDIPVQVLREAARRREVVEAMTAFYQEADRRIAQRPGTCWNRAACCRFADYGHRLHVTALEVVYYLATGDPPPPVTADACPHASDGKCHARDRRPLACRIFYCDPAARYWQGPLTEELLARLKEMHVELGVPYFYADWVTVLRACADYE
jgi:hypothetical protein